MVSIVSTNINDNMNNNKEIEKIEKIERNKVSIQDLPDDILNKLIYHTQETIKDKIEKIDNFVDLQETNRLMYKQRRKLEDKLSSELLKGCVYQLNFRWNREDFTGLYLMNSVYVNRNQNAINICKVEIDDEHQRLFGNYKIVEPSKRIFTDNIKSYKKVYEPPVVDWNNEPRQLIGITDILRVYGWEHQDLFNRHPSDFPTNILYCSDMVDIANMYCVAELFKVQKNNLIIAIPDNPLDTAPNRSISLIRVSKKYCYKLNNTPPHIRPRDIYGIVEQD